VRVGPSPGWSGPGHPLATVDLFLPGAPSVAAQPPPEASCGTAPTPVDSAVAALATPGMAQPVTATLPRASPAAVLARRSAAWESCTAGGEIPAGTLATVVGAARAVGVRRAVGIRRGEQPELVRGLAARSCGQPEVAAAAALVLVTGAAEPSPSTVLGELTRAGVAVHAAWLAATAAGLPARPVGCWVDAVGSGPDGRERVLHGLALGPPGSADLREPAVEVVQCVHEAVQRGGGHARADLS
ncbi:hypothetical protein ACFQE5_19140, partial [Pseudonocardia hispaniensis]